MVKYPFSEKILLLIVSVFLGMNFTLPLLFSYQKLLVILGIICCFATYRNICNIWKERVLISPPIHLLSIPICGYIAGYLFGFIISNWLTIMEFNNSKYLWLYGCISLSAISCGVIISFVFKRYWNSLVAKNNTI